MRERYPLRILQLRCEAEPDIVIARHHDRVQRGERHPIHRYDSDASGYLSLLQGGPLGWIELESTRIVVDTGQLQPSDYGTITAQIREVLKEEKP